MYDGIIITTAIHNMGFS